MKQHCRNLDWNDFKSLEIGDKLKYFTYDNRIFDILFSQQFSREFLDELFHLTNKIRVIAKTNEGSMWLKKLLSTKKAMLYFVQPSTRTFLSFLTACQTLGMSCADVRSTETSSEIKGESFKDTIRTFSSYFDLIIMRHPQGGYAELASYVLNKTQRPIPIINAGSGKDQHPTQALLDIYTLRRSFEHTGDLENKTIMMSGDLKRGRTVRSLCYLLTDFPGIKLIFSAPKELQMEDDIKSFLDKKEVQYTVSTKFEECIPEADAIYMTRIQDEWDEDGESVKIDSSEFKFQNKHLGMLKPNAILLHPLPRRDEINEDIDSDPRAVYWRQVRNGMWTRVALIAHIFKLNSKIMDK
jgi:aspartate carbamoyltransferase catalytic subunit